jgi:hypothetical protein
MYILLLQAELFSYPCRLFGIVLFYRRLILTRGFFCNCFAVRFIVTGLGVCLY